MIPTVSVIIPAYQHGKDLPECLASIFAQTFTDFEVILVNDGSTDDTERAIAPFRDRLTYISQENRGGNAARNRGFDVSKGKFLIFCDADIIMHPRFIEKLLAALRAHPEASYAYCSFRFGFKRFALWDFDAERLRRMNYITTTSLIRREHFPRFDEEMRRFQDWDLWLTMLERGHTGVWVSEELFEVIPHKGGISTWVPSLAYRIPWRKFGIRIPAVEKFLAAERIVKRKHNLA